MDLPIIGYDTDKWHPHDSYCEIYSDTTSPGKH